MARSTWLVVAGASVMLVLAGCLGGGSIGGSAPDAEPPEATWTEGETIDTTELLSHHVESLQEAGTFTETKRDVVRVNGDARPPDEGRPDGYYPPSITHRQIDLETDRLHRSTDGARSTDRYLTTEIDATRRKPCPEDDCDYEYRYHERSEDAPVPRAIDRYQDGEFTNGLQAAMEDANVTYTGTVDRDGETLYRYQETSAFPQPAPPFSEPPTRTVTVLITDDGVIRQFELQYAGTGTPADEAEQSVNVTQTFSVTYEAVGETTVDRPAWVDTAEASDEPPTTEAADS